MGRLKADRVSYGYQAVILLKRYAPKRFSIRAIASELGTSRRIALDSLLSVVQSEPEIQFDGKRYYSTKKLSADNLAWIKSRERDQASKTILGILEKNPHQSIHSLQKLTGMSHKFIKKVKESAQKEGELQKI